MSSRFRLIAGLFLISGATGLLYEVAFSKLLGYIFGATAYAVSAVLAAFMAGLALGAHLGGRRAGRVRRPLVAYGALEIGVGLVCAATPATFGLLTDAYIAAARSAPQSLALLTAVRALFAGLVVVLPTLAMGATLPILSRLIAGDAGGEKRLPVLYAINTAGGAMGSLAGAYFLLPLLGIRGTIFATAATNIVLGAVAIVMGRTTVVPQHSDAVDVEPKAPDAAPAKDDAAPADRARPDRRSPIASWLGALAFTSGLIVFAAEVTQTHLLALLIGNSAYAFGIMLAVFLVCLAAGAARAPKLAARWGDGALWRGLGAAGLAFAITLPVWDRLPLVFAWAGKHVTSWTGREITRALVAFVVLALPTLCLGTTFPLLLARVAAQRNVAAEVGRLTVANTVGTIVGSIATGYLILPLLGSEQTLIAIAIALALLSFVCAIAVAAEREPGKKAPAPIPIGAAALAGIAILLALVLPRWNVGRMTSGANVYFAMGPLPDKMEMVREDVHGGVTTVTRHGDLLTLYTNGKFQGDNGPEMDAQRRFAHFPSLFVREDRRALVIGLGTGTTLGTVSAYPFEHIDVVEISPAIVEASRRFFADQAFRSLEDPRVTLHVNDGRNFMLVHTGAYDLVTIELSSVWFAGASSLYSKEFYELVRSRLTEGGVLQQWVQLHHLRRRELACIIRTLRSVFPNVALFVGGRQGILVASEAPLVASRARLAEFDRSERLQKTLAGKHLLDTMDELVTSGEDLDRFIRESEADGGALIATDDNLYLEYATPKGNVLRYDTSLDETLKLLDEYRTTDVRGRHLAP